MRDGRAIDSDSALKDLAGQSAYIGVRDDAQRLEDEESEQRKADTIENAVSQGEAILLESLCVECGRDDNEIEWLMARALQSKVEIIASKIDDIRKKHWLDDLAVQMNNLIDRLAP